MINPVTGHDDTNPYTVWAHGNCVARYPMRQDAEAHVLMEYWANREASAYHEGEFIKPLCRSRIGTYAGRDITFNDYTTGGTRTRTMPKHVPCKM